MMPNQTSPKKTLRKKKTIVIFQRTKTKILPKIKKRKKSEDLKKTDKKKEPADSSDDDEKKEKKPTLASRITRPPQQTSTQTSPEVKKKKGKSYDYATKLNYLFRDARFFLVKSSVAENVDCPR